VPFPESAYASREERTDILMDSLGVLNDLLCTLAACVRLWRSDLVVSRSSCRVPLQLPPLQAWLWPERR